MSLSNITHFSLLTYNQMLKKNEETLPNTFLQNQSFSDIKARQYFKNKQIKINLQSNIFDEHGYKNLTQY